MSTPKEDEPDGCNSLQHENISKEKEINKKVQANMGTMRMPQRKEGRRS